MKEGKGFTIVELLSVIAILAVILLLTVPIIIKQIDNGKAKMWENQKAFILNSAEKYAVQYSNKLRWEIDEYDGKKSIITLRALNEQGFLDLPITNPLTEEEIDPDNTYVTIYKGSDGNTTFEYTD